MIGRLRGPLVAVTAVFAFAVCLRSVAEDKPCVAHQYDVSTVPLRPAGINQSGEIVGTSASDKAATWTPERGLQEIDLLPGFTSAEGVALNDAGQVIGLAIDLKTNRRQGFTYSTGKISVLSDGAKPIAINNAGEIAGEARTSSNRISGPVVWTDLTPLDLGGCCGGTALGINNQSRVTGNIYDSQGHYHAFLWEKARGLRRIGPPTGFSSAFLLNDAGDYVLQLFPGGLFLYRGDKPTHLILAPKIPSHPRAMNTCIAVVGSSGVFADSFRAFAWDAKDGFRDLNELIPADSGWRLQEATSINSRGEIVGWGIFRGEKDVGFLLTPLQ